MRHLRGRREDEPGFIEGSLVRRGKSNPRPTLKSRKLQILLNAKNVKTARNVFRGYAAATREASGKSQTQSPTLSYPKNYFI
jgi:hypothetical protein